MGKDREKQGFVFMLASILLSTMMTGVVGYIFIAAIFCYGAYLYITGVS